ncbi:MAG: isochorismatase family cysteine hydrolase [Nanoarchaeota archaeon]|nr:isochorismatase family cysteine hydrolase [Nanoarchaeota archaeon]
MKRGRLLSYVSEGLAALALAGTIFASTGCTTLHSYTPQQTLEQKVTKKHKIGNLAVLLIDMQAPFLKSILTEEQTKEIPYQIGVLDYCKQKNIPVFVLEYEGYGPTIEVLKEKVDSLEKKVYVTKSCDDGFTGTDLAEQLRKHNIDTLLLMGINATACVISTAEGALDAGFKIMTSKDLIADPSYFHSDEGVRWYSTYGVYSNSYKDVLDMISKGEVEYQPLPENNQSRLPSFVFPEELKKRDWKNPDNHQLYLQGAQRDQIEDLLNYLTGNDYQPVLK